MKKLCALFVLLLVGFSAIAEAQVVGVRVGVPSSRRLAAGAGGGTALPSYEWDPTQISGAIVYINTWNTGTMYSEKGDIAGATRPAADTNPVGSIVDPIGGFFARVNSDVGRPTLASDATVNSSLLFDSNSESLIVADSTAALRYFNSSRRGFILIKYKSAGGSGTNRAILDTNNGGGGNPGFYLRHSSDNKILFQISGGGGNLVSFSSTGTITDTNWHTIYVWVETATNKAHIQIDGGTATDSSALGSAVVADATGDLTIGNRTGGSTTMNGQFADLVIGTAESVSPADLALWAAYNPARNSNNTALHRILAAGASLDPDEINFVSRWYDLSDASTLWTTSAKAVQVSANADKIGFVENKKAVPSLCGSFLRHANQATDANRTAWATGVSNGLAAALFAGDTTDTSSHAGEQSLLLNGTQLCGDKTTFIVYRNLTTDPGGHLMWHGNTQYLAFGGSAYSTTNRRNLAVLHPVVGTPLVSATNPNGGESVGVFVIRRQGTLAKIWMCNRYDLSETGTANDWGLWNPTYFGRTGDTNWDWNGNLCEYLEVYGSLSDSTTQKLTNGFFIKWGISNVPTTLTDVAALDSDHWYKRLIARAHGEDQPAYIAALMGAAY